MNWFDFVTVVDVVDVWWPLSGRSHFCLLCVVLCMRGGIQACDNPIHNCNQIEWWWQNNKTWMELLLEVHQLLLHFLHSRSPPLLHACMCVWVCFILFIMFSIRRQMNTTTISANVPSTNSTNGFFLSAFSIALRMDWINNCSVLCVSPFNESFGCQYNVYCIRFKMI